MSRPDSGDRRLQNEHGGILFRDIHQNNAVMRRTLRGALQTFPKAERVGVTILMRLMRRSPIRSALGVVLMASASFVSAMAEPAGATPTCSTYCTLVMSTSPVEFYQLNEASGSTAVNEGTGGSALNGMYRPGHPTRLRLSYFRCRLSRSLG